MSFKNLWPQLLIFLLILSFFLPPSLLRAHTPDYNLDYVALPQLIQSTKNQIQKTNALSGSNVPHDILNITKSLQKK